MKRLAKVDGFGVAERRAVHAAVRQVWHRSLARRLAVKRATDPDGYLRCEGCGARTPKAHVDHIENVGEVGGPDYVAKMFVPSDKLRVLCPGCHREKTKQERATSPRPSRSPSRRIHTAG